ncbi:integrase, catalytic region, zinc finger, CCHC-type containing protein [Tanacetum coccineum]
MLNGIRVRNPAFYSREDESSRSAFESVQADAVMKDVTPSLDDASGLKPSGNSKNNRISQVSSSNKTNKVEDQSRSVKSRKNKKNRVDKSECNTNVMQSMLDANSVSESASNALVKHSVKNVKSESLCAICNKCLFDANHDMCLIDCVNDMNVRSKSKSKKNKKRKVWKPTGKVFIKIGYSWKPTGRTFTIVRNRCPLTRITSTKIVPPKESTISPVITPTQGILVYSRRPKASKFVGSSSKVKNVESNNPNSTEPNQSWGSTISDVPSFSLIDCRFGNDHISKIMGYEDYQIGNVTISQVYYVEGLGHNLFSVGQFCDSDLEVAFRKHTCFVRDLEGVDLLKGSRGSNLYTLSLENLMLSSPICLLSKASKTKQNRTLVEAARTMLIFLKALLFLWAEAVTTACYTQNRSLIRKHHNKTPYELLHARKPDLSYLHIFGALCYPTNDGEDLGKLKPKADIGIFVGYAPAKKAFRIYNKRTRLIIETIHVDFDELTAMASEQFCSGPGPKLLTPGTISSGLLNPSPSVDCHVPTVPAPEPFISTGTHSSTIINEDVPSTSTSQTTPETPSPVIHLGVEEADHDIEVAHIDNNPLLNFQFWNPV